MKTEDSNALDKLNQDNILKAEAEIKRLQEYIQYLKKFGGNSDKMMSGKSKLFPNNFPWKQVALKVLKDSNEFLGTEEIADKAIKIKPSLNGYDEKKIRDKFSVALSQLAKKNKKVDKIDNPLSKGNFWGLSEWFMGKQIREDYFVKILNKHDYDESDFPNDIVYKGF